MLSILKERYPEDAKNKQVSDIRDWGYRSICRNVTPKEIEDIYESEEFFKRVKVDDKFQRFYNENKSNFNFYVVTKGTASNLLKKEFYLKKRCPFINFIGLLFYKDEEMASFNKSSVDMRDGIHIDDRTDCLLSSNAAIKILVKNNRETAYNQAPINETNIYVVNTMAEALEIIEFANKYREFLTEGL